MINHRDRYRQIAEVLSRHSLGFFVSATGLQRRLPFLPTVAGHERRHFAVGLGRGRDQGLRAETLASLQGFFLSCPPAHTYTAPD